MAVTDLFRSQHEAILDVAFTISDMLDPGTLPANVSRVMESLAELDRRMTTHLLLEDQSLYPMLMCHPSEDVRGTAQCFVDEMGDLAEHFRQYKKRWMSVEQIMGSTEGFIRETREIFAAMSDRMDRENSDLYPLIDNSDVMPA